MKSMLALMTIMAIAFSCEKTNYRMELALENDTDDTILVQLYPKAQYQHGDSYRASDRGSGYLSAKFKIEPGSFAWLFTSENLDQKPHDLASKVFDSNSIWEYEHRKFNEATNFSQNPVETDTYTFTISLEKLSPQ